MKKNISKLATGMLVISLALLLISCSAAAATTAPVLIWKVDVSSFEVKDTLKTVESVTQYNGSKMDVVHQQTPVDGNIYLIIKVTLTKSGSASVPFDWTKLTVQDAAGKAYPRHPNDTFLEQQNYIPRLTGLEIRFGVNEGWICYEIPSQAAKSKLTLAYSADGSHQEVVLQK